MNENLTITNEVVEDNLLLLAQMERMGIQSQRWMNTFIRIAVGGGLTSGGIAVCWRL